MHCTKIHSSSGKPVVIKHRIGSRQKKIIFIAYSDGKIFEGDKLILDIGSDKRLIGFETSINFHTNGLFYVNYILCKESAILPHCVKVDPSNAESLNQVWLDVDKYSCINVLEEWKYYWNEACTNNSIKQRTILSIKNPFLGHEGCNTLDWSEEIDKLVIATGDGGGKYDPFNLSQDNDMLHGKILSIDVEYEIVWIDSGAISHYNELSKCQRSIIEIKSKGLMEPSSLYSCNGKTYVVDRGICSGKVYQGVNSKNYGWRAWDGVIPTCGKIGKVNHKQTIEESIDYCKLYWEKQTDETLYLSVNDKLFIESKCKSNIVECNKDWKPLKEQKYCCNTCEVVNIVFTFDREGCYYLSSSYHKNIKVRIVVMKDAEILRNNRISAIRKRLTRSNIKTFYTYAVVFRQESIEIDNERPIYRTLSDYVVSDSKSEGTLVSGFTITDKNVYICAEKSDKLSYCGCLKKISTKCNKSTNIIIKSNLIYTSLCSDGCEVYVGVFDLHCNKGYVMQINDF